MDDYEIYFKRSADSGANFGPWQRFTYNTGESKRPKVACSGMYVAVTYFIFLIRV